LLSRSEIAVDAAGSAYVVGRTSSEDFPAGGDPQTVTGGTRVFVTKLAPDGSSTAWLRYVGPTGDLTPADVALDGSGHVEFGADRRGAPSAREVAGGAARPLSGPRPGDRARDARVRSGKVPLALP
jgi:hypothetical protein